MPPVLLHLPSPSLSASAAAKRAGLEGHEVAMEVLE